MRLSDAHEIIRVRRVTNERGFKIKFFCFFFFFVQVHSFTIESISQRPVTTVAACRQQQTGEKVRRQMLDSELRS